MERAAWTNERLDDLTEAIRAGFARNDQDHREMRSEISALGNGLRAETATLETGLRGEMATLGTELRGEMVSLGTELRGEMVSLGTELRAEINGLRRVVISVGGGIIIALIGVIAAILAQGG